MNHHPDVIAHRKKAMLTEAKRLVHQITPFESRASDTAQEADFYACCLDCGARLVLSGDYDGDFDCGEANLNALTFSCHPEGNGLRALESQAWLLRLSPTLLLARFKRALEEEVPPHIRRFFDPGEFDPLGGFLRSDDQVWRLEWILREDPWMPIDEENPQGREGLVKLQRMVAEQRMRPARYVGPYLNPNIGRDKTLWEVMPLEPGELGWVYFSHEGGEDQFGFTPVQWRFRRSQGVTGYAIGGPTTSEHATSERAVTGRDQSGVVRGSVLKAKTKTFDFDLSEEERLLVEASQIPTPEEAEVQDPEVIAAIRAANGEPDWFE